jgi:hypothetical protein
MRMRVLPPLAALVLGAATAFLVACGGDDGRIPSSDAKSLESALNQVSTDFDAGECQAAQQAITKLNGALVNLPDSVDSRLRARLRSGVANLDERVQATCGQTQTQQQTQTRTQTQTQTNTDTDTDTTGTGTSSTGTTSTGTSSTGTSSTGTSSTGTTSTGTTGTSTGGDTTGGTPPGDGG